MARKKINDSNFGLRFRILLEYHDLTLRDISDATGAAVSTVGTWRNGRIPSSEKIIEKIAKLFHVTKEYLLNGNKLKLYVDRPINKLNKITKNMSGWDKNKPSTREKIEKYISKYLDRAEATHCGLEHTWIEIVKHFPLDFFDDIPSSDSDLPSNNKKF
jgi:transcriptional regulator with XRE-family HTH domain